MADKLQRYHELMEDRPEKMTAKDSGYRKSEGDTRCELCLHYYQRKLDGYGVCELVRPEPDEEVLPDMVCNYFTTDGEDFPLL